MNTLRYAVIGVGYLGRFHAEKISALPEQATLVAVCDVNKNTCDVIAKERGVPAVYDYHDLLGKVDAVSIAANTQFHYDIAMTFLNAGVHVLVEKPIASDLKQAIAMTALARSKKVVLQVGHLERFNAAILGVKPALSTPLFIDAQRLAPFTTRGADVNVVFDLMIHDIDLILQFVQSDILQIDAHGTPVLTDEIDIANVRLKFANGCVANLTASRVSFKKERKIRLFQDDGYISLDLQEAQYAIFRKGEGEHELFPGIPNITCEESELTKSDALLLEIKSFIKAIKTGTPPEVSGDDACLALQTATLITEMITHDLATRKAGQSANAVTAKQTDVA